MSAVAFIVPEVTLQTAVRDASKKSVVLGQWEQVWVEFLSLGLRSPRRLLSRRLTLKGEFLEAEAKTRR